MISLLQAPAPAPFDWLDLGLLAGPVGLILIGLGLVALRLLPEGDADAADPP